MATISPLLLKPSFYRSATASSALFLRSSSSASLALKNHGHRPSCITITKQQVRHLAASASASSSSPSLAKGAGEQYVWHRSSGSGSWPKTRDEKLELTVVLLGWLGAEQRHLRRYAEWYNSRGIHAITFILPMRELLSLSAVQRAESHIQLLYRDITQWVQQEGSQRRLMFHTFSNTGWIVYGELLDNFRLHNRDLITMIKGCVVDSAPAAQLDSQVWASGFAAAFLKKQSFSTQSSVPTLSEDAERPGPSVPEVLLLASLEKFFALLLAVPSLKKRLERVLSVLSQSQPPCPQLYIYSSADHVIPARYVESFMAFQKELGYTVFSHNMQLSPHVDHFRRFTAIYCQQLEMFIEACFQQEEEEEEAPREKSDDVFVEACVHDRS